MLSLALLVCLVSAGSPPSVEPPVPEVVVFVLDDISTFDLAGLPLPNLQALAARGLTFERAYGAPVCHPARRTMLSGEVWTHKDGSIPCEPHNGDPPPLGALPLAQLYADAGFLTMGFGKWHLGEDPLGGAWELAPMRHGFHHWFAGLGANVERCGGRHYRIWQRFEEGTSEMVRVYQTLDLLESFTRLYPPQRGPRFAWVALQAAHEPFHRPPDRLLPAGYPDTPDFRSQYEAMIVSADVALGEMLAVLDLARTLVVVVADNGTPPDVAPVPERAKGTTFERGVRVPLVIAGPGVVPGSVRTPVHIVDLFETLRERCGLDRSRSVRDSRSLVPCFTDARHRPRQHVFVGLDDDLALVTQRFKLREKAGVEELYDLVLDPHETTPLPLDAPRYRPVTTALRTLLAAERR